MQAIEWTPKDAAGFLKYLQENDNRLLQYIKQKVPKITGGNFEQAALEGKEKQGAEGIISELEDMSIVRAQGSSRTPYQDVTVGL